MSHTFRRIEALCLLLVLLAVGWGTADVAAAAEMPGSLNLNRRLMWPCKSSPPSSNPGKTGPRRAYNIGVARAAYLPQVNFVANYYYGNAFTTAARKPLTAATGGTVSSVLQRRREQIIIFTSFKPIS